VEIGTEAAQLPFWEYLFQIFDILFLQCSGLDLAELSRDLAKYWTRSRRVVERSSRVVDEI